MPKHIEIGIFQIAQTMVNESDVVRWMNYLGAEKFSEEFLHSMQDDVLSEPAALIAIAAKRCYMSFEPGLNPNVTKVRKNYVDYFDNILKSGHGCYDGETEVLTDQGWIRFDSLSAETLSNYRFASLNKDGSFDYAPAASLVHSEYRGDMCRIDGKLDLLVTPNHRMYSCLTTTKEGRKRENYQIIEAQQIGYRSHCHLKSGEWKDGHSGLLRDEAAIIGFSIGDGTTKSSSVVEFHLRRERKILWLENLCTRNGWHIHYNGDKYSITLPNKVMQWILGMYDENGEKQIPSGMLTTIDKETLLGLYEGLIQSDGSVGETDITFHTTSEKLGDDFQQLCLHVGLSANRGKTYEGWERNSFGDKPLTTWHVIRRGLQPEVNKYDGTQTCMYRVFDWSGYVYCVELEPSDERLGVLYVRRNGIPVWCGNSVLEHATFTFALEGVSRVFTAEMNRHRAGWAISEGSLRFIRFDKDIGYWVPTSLQGNDVLTPGELGTLASDKVAFDIVDEEHHLELRKQLSREIFDETFAFVEKQYARLLAIWDMDENDKSFAYKKHVTSCLRRIVPLGVATGGVWTGNVRALRHVLAMRCSPVAEEEILYVFSRVAEQLVELQPLLFGDFSKETGHWMPKYSKV